MSSIPFSSLIPVVAIFVMLGAFFVMRMLRGTGTAGGYSKTLGTLAQELGLQITKGDPMQDMVTLHTAHQQSRSQAAGGVVGTLMGDRDRDSGAHAQGVVWGRPYDLNYEQHTELRQGVLEHTTTEWFDFSLGAALQVQAPAFEILGRNIPSYIGIKPQTTLRPQPTGNAVADAHFIVKTDDPRLAAALAPALVPLVEAEQSLHIVGGGAQVRAITSRLGYLVLLTHGVAIQRSLEQIACTLEGRPATHVGG